MGGVCAQAAVRDVQEKCIKAMPSVVTCTAILCFSWQPMSGTIQHLQEGTMEASGRTPTSPTHRVQTVIQVSMQDHRTSALWEQGSLSGSPLQPALPPALALHSSLSSVSANPITGSSAKPIELSGWQFGSS